MPTTVFVRANRRFALAAALAALLPAVALLGSPSLAQKPAAKTASCCAPQAPKTPARAVQVAKAPARCTGSAYCSACTNCSRCAHCSAGGTCGVCAGTSSGRASSSYGSSGSSWGSSASSYSAPAPSARPRPRPTPTPPPKTPAVFTAKVVGIADGDTLTVLTASNRQIKVRLNGIDAPESRQAFGTASRKNLANLTWEQQVTVRNMGTDRYGRLLGVVTSRGKDVNREQVRLGMAWWYKQYAPKDAVLADLEKAARAGKVGLWADAKPTPPWEFRRGNR